MKKVTSLIPLLFCVFFAQSQNSLQIKAGLFFNPQGYINWNWQNPEKGFSGITPLFAVLQLKKGPNVFNAMYNLTYNNLQGVYWHGFTEKVGGYILLNKNIFAKKGYASIGITREVADGRAIAFAEFGSTWNEWNPQTYIGVAIPMMFQIK